MMNHRLLSPVRMFPLVCWFASASASVLLAGPESRPAPAPRPAPPAAEAVVRYPGVTKAYWVRRYVDPANPRILHGGHVVYRREDDGGWILQPARPTVESGPSAGSGRFRTNAAPLTAELAAELARQRAATEEVRTGAQRFKEAQETLTREAAEVARLVRELQTRLPGQSEAEVKARAAQQAELKRLTERLERLEKAAPPQSITPPAEPAKSASAPAPAKGTTPSR